MLVAALPPRHKVQHVDAVGGLPFFLAFVACQLDLKDGEHWQTRRFVAQADQSRVEVDPVTQGGYSNQSSGAHDHQGRHRLVEEAGVHVRGLFQDDDVAPGALGGLRL